MKPLLHLLTHLFSATLLFAVACTPPPVDEPIDDPNNGPNTDTPTGGEKPTTPPVLKGIASEEGIYAIDFSDEATVYILVEEAGVTSVGAEGFALVGEESDVPPATLSLRKCEPTETAGRWRLFVANTFAEQEFSERVRVRLDAEGKQFYTDPFVVVSRGLEFEMKNFRFLREDNPSLTNDITMAYDTATSTFRGATELPLDDMTLIPRFESNATVRIDGVEQHSGLSAVDFTAPVEYTIDFGTGSKTYTVDLNNFTGLPIIYITTDDRGPVTSKDDWKSATLSIDGAGLFDDLEPSVVNIRGRGNTTWGWPKKPYALKFESKTEVLGMPKHKRWVLLANAMDKSMVRNRLAFRVAQQTSLAWTPRNEYAELFLNGKHMGTYLVTEHIKVDKNRVNITEMEPTDNEGEAVTGGYLFELDFHFDNEKQWRTPRNMPFAIKSPDEEDLTNEQFKWAQDYINNLEALIHSNDFLDPEKGYMNFVDRQSFVDYWIVFEVCLNHEIGNPGSVYMHKDRGGKLTAGPIWDFDWGTFSYNVSTWAPDRLYLQGTLWYGRMFGDPEFRALAKERWIDIYPRLQSLASFIDAEQEYLRLSAVKNFAMWNPMDTGGINGDEALPWAEAYERVRTIYLDRIEDINRIITTEW